MNERIKKIYEECGVYTCDANPEASYREIEFFAEQIIKECARIDSEMNNPDHIDGETFNQTILAHFGLDE